MSIKKSKYKFIVTLEPKLDTDTTKVSRKNLETFLLGLDRAYRGEESESSEDIEDSIEETDEEVEGQTAEVLLARLRRRIEGSLILLEISPEVTWKEVQ